MSTGGTRGRLLGRVCTTALMIGAVTGAAVVGVVGGTAAAQEGVVVSQPAAAPPPPPAAPPADAPVITAPTLNPTQRVLNMTAPLKDAEILLGEVEIRVNPGDLIEVSAERVVELLSRGLNEDALAPLIRVAQPGVFLPLSDFATYGFPMTFDFRALEVRLQIPPEARARRSIGLANLDRELVGDFQKPEPFSFYTNIRGGLSYVHRGSDEGFGDPTFFFDSAMNIRGLVLENEASYSPGDDDTQFVREGTRLVWDDTERLHRWIAGDLRNQPRGFQSTPEVAGLSLSRLYSQLDPQRNLAPRGDRSFTVSQASTVEVFINDREVRTIRLQPGTYNINDFPFVQGFNDVRLVVQNEAGIQEVISFSMFMDRTQLAPGLSEYSVYAGARAYRDQDGQLEYESDDWIASGFYRRGVTDTLTLGVNGQADNRRWLVGSEFVWGTRLGTLGGDLAASGGDGGDGYAANITFERLAQTESGSASSIIAAVEVRSERFGSLDAIAPDNPFAYVGTISWNRSFGETSFVGARARYAVGRGPIEDEWSVAASYGRRLGERTNVVVEAEWAQQRIGGDDVTFRVGLIRRFGDRASASARYDSREESVRLGYQTSRGMGVGAWNANADLDYTSDRIGFNGSAGYTHNRADLGISHTTAWDQIADDISDQRTSVRFGTSIAYAGGSFAIGRPVTDSFAIVKPYRGLGTTEIIVEPNDDGYAARADRMGPALYGQVSAYSPRTITYDAPEAAANIDIGTGSLRMMPRYKSGFVTTVGSAYGVTAIGALYNREGEPIKLLAGKATEIGGEGRVVEVFTNGSGRFGASGLKAGRWRIEMPGSPPTVYEVTIPESDAPVVRLGDLRPQ